jgi:hypothetical protein
MTNLKVCIEGFTLSFFLFTCYCNSFAQITTSDTVVPENVKFIATNLVNFDNSKLSWLNEPINVDSLKWKKDRALFLLDSVVNLSVFKQEVIKGYYTHTNGLSNEQIFEEFMSPKYKNIREHLTLVIDTTWRWNVKYQRRRHPSIGYDNEVGDSIVHTVQVQLVKYLTPEDYAEHIAHEYCHMIGFAHRRPRKWQGVPYGIQHVIEKLLTEKSISR